jgi:hypothetical protein
VPERRALKEVKNGSGQTVRRVNVKYVVDDIMVKVLEAGGRVSLKSPVGHAS